MTPEELKFIQKEVAKLDHNSKDYNIESLQILKDFYFSKYITVEDNQENRRYYQKISSSTILTRTVDDYIKKFDLVEKNTPTEELIELYLDYTYYLFLIRESPAYNSARRYINTINKCINYEKLEQLVLEFIQGRDL